MTFARVRAIIFVSVLFFTATVVVLMAINRDSQTRPVQASTCPSGLIPANVTMPEQRNEVTLNVYNGTKIVDLAKKVGNEFANRGFHVARVATAAGNKVSDEVAEITYGPQGVGAAWLVSAYFLVDGAEMHFELHRTGAEVDVLIGTKFQQLATTTEVNQSIAALGKPSLPEGTCEL